jgi:uncharacterized protein involved in outer membrane biogenesis
MKWVKRIALIVILLIIIAGVVTYFSLNAIVRGVAERQASASLGVTTTVGGASIGLFGGSFGLSTVNVSSPPNFNSPSIFSLDNVGLDVHYRQLFGTPIHIQKIEIDHPVVVVEQSGLKLNLDALMDQMPQTPKTSGGQETQPIKLIIDELDLNNAQVNFLAGIPHLPDSMQVPIASLTLKNIGNADGNQNGAAIKDVVMQTTVALTIKAVNDSKLSPDVKTFVAADLNILAGKLGPGFADQYQSLAGQLIEHLPPKAQSAANQLLNGLQQLKGK